MTDLTSLSAQGQIIAPAASPPEARPLGNDRAGMPPYLEVAEWVPQPAAPTPSSGPPDDPPIFLLQAAPTWAGGILPDGVWQRVPIGVTGQVLTVQADGSIAWITGGGGFSNPMTLPLVTSSTLARPGCRNGWPSAAWGSSSPC